MTTLFRRLEDRQRAAARIPFGCDAQGRHHEASDAYIAARQERAADMARLCGVADEPDQGSAPVGAAETFAWYALPVIAFLCAASIAALPVFWDELQALLAWVAR